MGLRREYLDLIHRHCDPLAGQRMLELGNQTLKGGGTGKQYFSELGVDHTSVDINGKDGALPYDLREPDLRPDWTAAFDVLTNCGTTEHVEPHAAQYECWANLHRWLKPGGVAVHVVPDVHHRDQTGRWAHHCRNFYSDNFFRMLAREAGYSLLESCLLRGHRAVALKKIGDRPFVRDPDIFLSLVARRKKGGRRR